MNKAAWVLFHLLLAGASAHAQRVVPSQDVTVYVAPATDCVGSYWPGVPPVPIVRCGDDVVGNGTQEYPWATPQRAWDVVAANYDLQCKYKVTIQLAARSGPPAIYRTGLNASGRLVGQCGSMRPLVLAAGQDPYIIGKAVPVTLQGDVENVTGANITPWAGNGSCVTLTEGAAMRLIGFICDTTHSKQDGIDVFWGSHADISHLWFGNAGIGSFGPNLHMGVAFSSSIIVSGPYWVTGAAYAHVQVGQESSLYFNNNGDPQSQMTVNILNNPLFGSAYIIAENGNYFGAQVVYNGPARGRKFWLIRGGTIETGTGAPAGNATPITCNQAAIPGDQPGEVIAGGGICH